MEMQWDLVSCWGIGSHECENRLYKSFCFCTWNWFDFRCLFSWFFGTGGTPSSTCSLLPLLKSSIVISTKRSTGLRLGQDLRVLLQAIVALHVPAHHAVSLRYADPHHIRHVVLPHHAPEPMRGPRLSATSGMLLTCIIYFILKVTCFAKLSRAVTNWYRCY